MAGPLSDDELEETHEINVTPFIDVILVLLIIFMVAAPLSTVDIAVDLPAASAKAQPRPEKPVFVTIRKDLSLALGDADVAKSTLAAELDRLTASKKDERIFIRADKSVAYEALIDVMNLLRTAGYLKVALVGLVAGDRGARSAAP
ncbi:MAG: TonB system transport protein ExbD [Proteobacteria bacterium]|nr:TonB system transport protein ExbD [Pseudomonadota bacterium]